MIDEYQALGIKIKVQKCDIAVESQLTELILQCKRDMPRIGGVVHAAMVLKVSLYPSILSPNYQTHPFLTPPRQDKLFENIDIDDWNQVIKPRVDGAWNIHKHCPDLDFFVLLASITGIVGNKGQAAYAASNTFMDAFAEYRAIQGLPASTIDLGMVADVGYVAQSDLRRRAQISALTHDAVKEKELHALLKGAVLNHPATCSWRRTVTMSRLQASQSDLWWCTDPRFSHIVTATDSSSSGSAADTQDASSQSVRKALQAARSTDEALQVLYAALVHKVSSISMTPAEDISIEKPLAEYGLDSLVAVEIRNWITNELYANVPLLELANSPSLQALAGAIAANSKLLVHLMPAPNGDTVS